MNMRKILYIITASVVTVAIGACGGGHPDGISREVADSVLSLGRADGEILRKLAPGSMEHEGQIMNILSRKQSLERAGYPNLAKEYVTAARSVGNEDSIENNTSR